MRSFRFTVSLAMAFLMLTAMISAQTGSPLTVRFQPVVSGLTSPLLATNAKDGTKRLFIVQQGGIIKVVQPGSNVATNFINISSRLVAGGEQGLLGLAFHPQFATNGYFFVNYTRTGDGATVIARYKTTSAANALGDPASERILLVIPQPFSNHNGGMIEFRNDNGVDNLYIGMGDGGSANDPGNRAQNINDLLGKFLRITPDVSGSTTAPAYTNPPDNPFVGVAGADEIYAVGLRNPFRWSFDRGGTRQLWAGDVGQGTLEEVDIITKGGNFGWRIYEGTSCTNITPSACIPANFIPPVFQYSSTTARCSITGGYVYRGGLKTLPDGTYVYGDYCTGEILMWNGSQQLPLLGAGSFDLSSFGEDEDGELYVCGLGTGTVRKLVRAKASADFDGDFKTDFSVFRPSNGTWYRLNSGTNNSTFTGITFGQNGDIPTPEDFDGDNTVDIALFRPSTGTWFTSTNPANNYGAVQFGQAGDIPAAGDYDGDAKADVTVFRPANGTWYRLNSRDGSFYSVAFGANGDKPVAGDYDGDGKYDIAVFRPSNGTWYRLNSTNNSFSGVAFGAGSDTPAQGDFDGDGKTDLAVYRASTGVWYVLRSSDGTVQGTQFGASTDIPAVGDYDGDGRDDIAVFRPSNGTWFALQSSNSQVRSAAFGANGDLPVPTYDMP